MSFSVSSQSGMYSESSSALSEEYSVSEYSRSVYSRSESVYSSQAPSQWWHAEKLSETFCEGVEQRMSCNTRNDDWKDIIQDETLDDDESTLNNSPAIDTEKIDDNIKSYSFFAQYHSSKTKPIDEKDPSEEIFEKEKEVLNKFTQGNHRGWGPVRSTSTQNRSATNTNIKEILKENHVLSDEDTTLGGILDESESQMRSLSLTDGETCDDTHDDTLEYTSHSSYPDDEASSDDERKQGKYSKSLRKNVASEHRSSVSSSPSKDLSDASRNDTMRYSVRDNDNSNSNSNSIYVDLERESPSFGSNTASLKLKEKHSRSFSSQPSISSIDGSHSSNSQGTTFARPSYVTPKKILANYQSPSKIASKTAAAQARSRERANTKSGGKNKTIALGKSRATARLIKEQAAKSNSKPKTFPYIINHSLFHQNLDKKKTRSQRQRRTGE